MKVRKLGRSEWQLWKALRLRALADSPDAFGRTFEAESQLDDADWEERVSRQPSLVVKIHEDSVGIASCRIDDVDGHLGHLYAMWIAPEARREGAGRALVNFALTTLDGLGAREVELTVTEGNLGALELYESTGFVDTGHREQLREGSPLQVIRMRRRL